MNHWVRQQAYQLTLSPCLGTKINVSFTKVHSRKINVSFTKVHSRKTPDQDVLTAWVTGHLSGWTTAFGFSILLFLLWGLQPSHEINFTLILIVIHWDVATHSESPGEWETRVWSWTLVLLSVKLLLFVAALHVSSYTEFFCFPFGDHEKDSSRASMEGTYSAEGSSCCPLRPISTLTPKPRCLPAAPRQWPRVPGTLRPPQPWESGEAPTWDIGERTLHHLAGPCLDCRANCPSFLPSSPRVRLDQGCPLSQLL